MSVKYKVIERGQPGVPGGGTKKFYCGIKINSINRFIFYFRTSRDFIQLSEKNDSLIIQHHSQIGRERGEGIGGDLRFRGGNGRNESGLSRIGQAEQAHIRKDLELQPDVFFLSGFTGLGKTRHLHGRGLEMRISLAAPAVV